MAMRRRPPTPNDRPILVTGATGTLGREVVAVLDGRTDVQARVVSRRPRPADTPARREWVTADLAADPLDAACSDVDAVIHLASEKGAGDADVRGTARLLEAAGRAGVRHVVVISIIGCDRIPLPFYTSKQQIEAVTRAAGVPWSIVRVAQFHSFVARLVAEPAGLPLPTPIFADLRFQPVDEREVAERLVEVALGTPIGDAPELAGPEILTLGEIADAWLAATGRRRTLVPIRVAAGHGDTVGVPPREPWVTDVLDAYRDAANTPRGERVLGRVRFADWLRQRRRSTS